MCTASRKLLGIENLYDVQQAPLVHYMQAAVKAKELFKRDKEYVVDDGEIIIVDEFTGRKMPGRRWSDGIHQSVEAKEGVRIKEEQQTLATITIQNYFRMYDKLAGMTGTAMTESQEFDHIYKLEVVEIPTNQPMVRQDKNDLIYKIRGREVRGHRRRRKGTARQGPARPNRNGLHREERAAVASARAAGHPARRPEREVGQRPRARGDDHRAGRTSAAP